MRSTSRNLGLLSCFLAGLTFAYSDTWTGRLVDSACATPSSPSELPKSCQATQATSQFAVLTQDGKIYKFDAEGNVKTATAMRGFPDTTSPMIKVTGLMDR